MGFRVEGLWICRAQGLRIRGIQGLGISQTPRTIILKSDLDDPKYLVALGF